MNVQSKPLEGTNRPALITADQLATDFAHVVASVAALEARCKTEAPVVVEDDEDIGIINGLVVDLRKQIKGTEATREDEKRPYLDACSVLQGFFAALKERLAKAQEDLEGRGKRYLDKKRVAEQERLAEIARQERAESERRATAAAAAAAAQKPVEAAVANQQAQAANTRADAATERAAAKPAELARTRTESGTATLQEIWRFQIEAFALVDLDALRPYLAPADVEKAIGKFVAINKNSRPLAGVKIWSDTKPNFR